MNPYGQRLTIQIITTVLEILLVNSLLRSTICNSQFENTLTMNVQIATSAFSCLFLYYALSRDAQARNTD